MTGHVGPVLSVAFSPDGRTLASGSVDRTVKLWSPGIDQELGTLTGPAHDVWSVAFSPDGETLAAGVMDHTVMLWRASTFTETDG